MLQKTKTHPQHVFISFSIIFLALLFINSCKKTDTLIANNKSKITNEKTAENFFNLPANASPVLKRIAKELEKQNKSKEFIKAFIAKEGFPIWDKASIERHKRKIKPNSATDFDGEGLEDTTVYIPLVVSAQQYVHGFLKATVMDTVEIKIFRQNDYANFPFQTPTSSSSVTTAEDFALRMMVMDKDVFGSKEFKVVDKRMFQNSTDYSDTADIQRYIRIDSLNGEEYFSDGTTINNYQHEECFSVIRFVRCQSYTGSSSNYEPPCWERSDIYICHSWEVGEEGPPPGGGGGGGGTWPYLPPGGPTGGGAPCEVSFGSNIVNSFAPIECNPGPGGNPWPTRNARGYLFTRIAELNYKLSLDPAAIEPCDSLNIMPLEPAPGGFGSMWQNIAQYQLPEALEDRIDSVNALFTGGGATPSESPFNIYQQTLGAASGGIVNCDFFPVKITQMPSGYTAQSLLEYFRKNLKYFAQPSNTFEPYNYTWGIFNTISFNDSARFNAPYQSSLGALVHIGIFGNNGSVIESKYENYTSPPYNHESHQFMMTTLHSPLDDYHPVAGNRAWGIYNSAANPSQYTFYTMGVDRTWDWMDGFLNSDPLGNIVFSGADDLWTNMQTNIISFINGLPGGQATTFPTPRIIARPDWDDVEEYLKGFISWEMLKERLGC